MNQKDSPSPPSPVLFTAIGLTVKELKFMCNKSYIYVVEQNKTLVIYFFEISVLI
jgi:hypothetical protein